MTPALERTLAVFEKRMAAQVDSRGLVIWLAPIRKLFADAYRALAEARENHSSIKRRSYGQLMLAETELQQLRAELADSPANAREARVIRIDSILERLYAAKGILSAIALAALLTSQFQPFDDEPARRERARTRTIRIIRIKEDLA